MIDHRKFNPEWLAKLRAAAITAPVGASIRTVLTPSPLELEMWMRNEVTHAVVPSGLADPRPDVPRPAPVRVRLGLVGRSLRTVVGGAALAGAALCGIVALVGLAGVFVMLWVFERVTREDK